MRLLVHVIPAKTVEGIRVAMLAPGTHFSFIDFRLIQV